MIRKTLVLAALTIISALCLSGFGVSSMLAGVAMAAETTTAVTISATTLPTGYKGSVYPATTLAASGGAGTPYGWTWVAAADSTLPPGLSLSTAGVITGTPTATGTFSVVVTAKDSASNKGSSTLSITVKAGVSVTTTTLPTGYKGSAYKATTLAASGGAGAPYTWTWVAAADSTLPPGLSLSTAGVVTGTPTATGTFSAVVTAKDSASNKGSATLSILIKAGLTITTTSLPPAYVGAGIYSQTLLASGGSGGNTWSVSGASNLDGFNMILSSAGVVSGWPGSTGTVSFTAEVTDSNGDEATRPLTIAVYYPLALPASGALNGATVGQNYGCASCVNASGGSGSNYTFTVNVNGVPTTVPYTGTPLIVADGIGVTSNANQLIIGGTPTTATTVTLIVSVKDGAGDAAGPNTYTILVSPPPAAEVSGNINANICGNNGNQPGITVAISATGFTTLTTTTDNNGNYSFPSIPSSATPYTITPSISGPTAVFYPATQSVTVSGSQATANFKAALGYTVSGNVSYGGSKTGQIYVYLNNNCGGSPSSGTSMSAKGSYTIRGVPPGNYTLQAYMDNLGYGAENASNPTGSTSNVGVFGSNATVNGVNVTMSDPAPITLTTAPSIQTVSAFDGLSVQGAFVEYGPITNSNKVEKATSYTVEWSTSSAFTGTPGSKTFPATGPGAPRMIGVTGLAARTTYYFRIQGTSGSSTTAWSVYGGATPTGVAIAAPTAANTVSGTVTFTQTAAGPLYVGFFNPTTGNMYFTAVGSQASPPTSPASYSVEVPTGNGYYFCAILDQANTGLLVSGFGYISNFNDEAGPPIVNVAGDIKNEDTTLLTGNSQVTLRTSSQQLTNGNGTTTTYSLGFHVYGLSKLPVAVALVNPSTPDVVIPMDIAASVNDGGNREFQFWANIYSDVPKTTDSYSLQITYSDATSETLTVSPTAVLANAFATLVSPAANATGVSATPNFSWTDPANASNYVYQFTLSGPGGGGTTWQIPPDDSPSNGFASNITSITWDQDPTKTGDLPSVSTLVSGTTFNWTIQVEDANGNTASSQANFTTSGYAPLTFSPCGTPYATINQQFNWCINVEGGDQANYTWTVNGTVVTSSNNVSVSIPNGNGLTANNTGGNTLSFGGTPTSAGPVTLNVSVKDVGTGETTSGTYTVNVINPNAGYPVSGTVNYAGSKTGWIYLALNNTNCNGCGSNLGTAIPAAGAFTIHGVPAGTYTVQAFMDNLGYGGQNASNPIGSSQSFTVSDGLVSGVSVTLADPAPVNLGSATPTWDSGNGFGTFNGGAFVSFDPIINNNDIEEPMAYTVEWSTSSSFKSVTGSQCFPATGGNQSPWAVSGVPNGGPCYFRAAGMVGACGSSTTGLTWSAASPAVTIGAPSSGNTVTGAVTFSGTATGPLYVGFYNTTSGDIYADVVGSETSPPMSGATYTVQVPTASNYYFFGLIDQKNDGLMVPGDISNTNNQNMAPIAISAKATENLNLTPDSANDILYLRTNSNQQTNLSGNTSTFYQVDLRISGLYKLPAGVELTSAPSYLVTPVDIATEAFNGYTDEFDYWPNLNGNTPSTSDVYKLTVTNSDGSTNSLSGSPTAVLSAFATGLSPTWNTSGVSTQPTFTWSYPANAGNYSYIFQLQDSNNNTIWSIPPQHSGSNGFSSGIKPSITWGVDPTNSGDLPSVPSLNGNSTYTWSIQVSDSNQDEAVTQVSFQTAESPLSLPSGSPLGSALVNMPYSGSINASGGSGNYAFTVNGVSVPTYNSSVSIGLDGLLATNSGGSTLFITGTPTTITTLSVPVTVEDTSNTSDTVSHTYSLPVVTGPNGANNGNLKGTYVCRTDGYYDVNLARWATLSSVVLDGNGNIKSGAFDNNSRDNADGPAKGTLSGTYSIGPDNNGLATVNGVITSGGSTGSGTFKHTWALALTNLGEPANPAQEFRMIETDDVGATPSHETGSADCYLATTSVFATDPFSGNGFVWGIHSEESGIGGSGGTPKMGIGRFNASSLAITDGYTDQDTIGSSPTNTTFTGSYTTPDATTGRATVTFTTSDGSLVFAIYVIDANRMFMLDITDAKAQVGDLRKQQQATYSDTNLSGPLVWYQQGYEGYSNGSPTGYKSEIDQISVSAGTLTLNQSYSDDSGTYTAGKDNGQSLALPAFDSSNPGRLVIPFGSSETGYMYFFNNNSAIYMDANGSKGDLQWGWIVPQTLTTFTDAAVQGNYLAGQLPKLAAPANDSVGEVDLSSTGGITVGASKAGEEKFAYDQSISGTYSWDTTAPGTGSFLTGGNIGGLSCVVISSTESVCIDDTAGSANMLILQQ